MTIQDGYENNTMSTFINDQSVTFVAQTGTQWDADFYLFLLVSGLVCAGFGFLYNRFIEGRLRPFGYQWDQDGNTDLSVVVGNGMVTLSIVAGYAFSPHISWVQLLLLMVWYWAMWGMPMILGYRQRGVVAARSLSHDLLSLTGKGEQYDNTTPETDTGEALAGWSQPGEG